jgi:hypothetical protein
MREFMGVNFRDTILNNWSSITSILIACVKTMKAPMPFYGHVGARLVPYAEVGIFGIGR